MVVRHHRLGDDYWAAISYRLGLIALSSFRGVYFVETHDAFGLRIGNRPLLVTDEVTILSIYARSFDPFFWISKKYMASRSSAKSLSFYFHTRLGYNFNISSPARPCQCR